MYIKYEGIKVFYEQHGKGKPIIFLHGWGSNSRVFLGLIKSIKNHQVTLIDFPGFGRSDEPSSVWNVDNYSKMLKYIIDDLKIENPIIVGHSFGCRVAAIYASKYQVDKLILMGAAGLIDNNKKVSFKVRTYKVLKRILTVFNNERLIRKLQRKFGSSDYVNSSEVMKKILSNTVNEDLTSYYETLENKTLLLWGYKDKQTPMYMGKRLFDLIQDSQLFIFTHAGHYVFIDEEDKVIDAIKTFIGEI